MIIRRAEIEDAKALSKIALAAKAFWKYPESWLDSWQQALTITPEFINHNKVFLAFSDTKTIGFYALVMKEKTAQLEHLWIAPEFIGKGFGGKLFKHALQTARSLGATSIEIESDPNAEEFYRKQGAVKFGENISDIEGNERVLSLMLIEL